MTENCMKVPFKSSEIRGIKVRSIANEKKCFIKTELPISCYHDV